MEDTTQFGGKGRALAALRAAGFAVPAFVVYAPGEAVDAARLEALSGSLFAVRSSALSEDGADHSFAGQLDSFLNVERAAVADYVAKVRASGSSERVQAYRAERGLGGDPEPAVVVQCMVDARCAGVAFSVDPIRGRRRVAVVAAVAGLARLGA